MDSIMDVVKRVISREKGPEIEMDYTCDGGCLFLCKNGSLKFNVLKYLNDENDYVGIIEVNDKENTYIQEYSLVLHPTKSSENYMDQSDKFYDQPILEDLKKAFLELQK